jgi:hypothetical protein
MKTRHLALIFAFVLTSSAAIALEAGERKAPARDIPVPTEGVSPAAQALIAAPLQGIWNDHPKNAAEWKVLIKARQRSRRRCPICARGSASRSSR